MRICLIARNRFHADRRALAIHHVLVRAGHEMSVVAVDGAPPIAPVVATVPREAPARNPILGRSRRLLPAPWRHRSLLRRLVDAAVTTHADIFVPLHEEMLPVALEAARRSDGTVQCDPRMGDAGSLDLAALAPENPQRALPVHGIGRSFTPDDPTPATTPEPNRHHGEHGVLCFRKTAANPGRYLESALRRSGIDVRVETEAIDLSTVDPAARFVVFVEGPYPGLEVIGTTEVPVLFWAHHGEHHLFPNLRLTDRYRADAVLLAHSWHLAHWFPAPVHRFPFAVATELFGEPLPLQRRSTDVAMVGSKLRSEAWQYRHRRELVEALESTFPADRVRFAEGVSPEVMAGLYEDARIVLDEGGLRHHPITMRVFEAIGAGAVLLTDSAPGLSELFEPGRDYARLGDDAVDDVRGILDDLDSAQAMAESAWARAMTHHTYDHRVDLLVAIAEATEKREIPPDPATTDLARLVAADVEVQRLVHDGATGLDDELAGREVWALRERDGRLHPGNMDAAVITSGDAEEMHGLLDSARRYIYATGEVSGLEGYLRRRHPDAEIFELGALRRVDLMAESYRVSPARSNG